MCIFVLKYFKILKQISQMFKRHFAEKWVPIFQSAGSLNSSKSLYYRIDNFCNFLF